VRAARDYGAYRVLMRLAFQIRLFPYPTWGALDRPNAMTPREAESRLAKVFRLRAPGVYFLVTDECVTLSLPRDATFQAGLDALPETTPFCLLTRPAPDANALLVWRPGQDGPRWISEQGSEASRLSGSCFFVNPGATSDQALPLEDGYSLDLSAESWSALSAALREQRALSLKLEDGKRLEVAWF